MFEQQQIKEKSFFWIISTLLITVIIIGKAISFLLVFIAGFALTNIFSIDFIDKYAYVIAGISYFISYLIAGRIGVGYFSKKTRINKKELKKIIWIFLLFPIAIYFIIYIPVQLYIGGLKFVIAIILFAWNDFLISLVVWIITSLAVFYWLNKKAVSEDIERDKIRKLEIAEFTILILLTLGFIWFFTIDQKSKLGPTIEDLSLAEILDMTSLKKDSGESEVEDWMVYKNEEYGLELKYPRSWNINVKTGKESSYFNYYEEEEFVDIDICEGIDKIEAPSAKNYICVRVYCEARPLEIYSLEQWLLDDPEIEEVKRILQKGAERIDILEAYGVGLPNSFLANTDTICKFHKYLNYYQEEYHNKETLLDTVYEKILSNFRFTN